MSNNSEEIRKRNLKRARTYLTGLVNVLHRLHASLPRVRALVLPVTTAVASAEPPGLYSGPAALRSVHTNYDDTITISAHRTRLFD
jgi:hypothetical protein